MLLHQRHYALVPRLDRRDRLDISALPLAARTPARAFHGCDWAVRSATVFA